ncbi:MULTISPECIES: ImuA family protein [unclassified Rhizobium]|uniref:ImuA family protein n=1 Tax=unclassified Rhizobium TaxID=2613769 RepID=UPI00382830CE
MAEAAVARETLFALRETIARLEGRPIPALAAAAHEKLAATPATRGAGLATSLSELPVLATGVEDLDVAMQGGLPLDALTEIRSLGLRDAGAASGFTLALAAQVGAQAAGADAAAISPILWIGDTVATMEAGLPYAIGLRDFGLEPTTFLQASPRKLEEALWLAEAALGSAAFAVVILEVRGNPSRFGLTESRRLALRAKAAGRPLFLLRQGGEEEASSALFRFSVEPAPAQARPLPDGSVLGGSIGHPAFRLTLEKSRNPAPLSITLEWNAHDRRFAPVSDVQHPAFPGEHAAYSGADLSASADRPHRAQALGAVVAFDRQA